MNVETKQKTDLYRLYQFLKNSEDTRRTQQLKSFIEKQNDNRFIICFSGHFSAGKSSLINELMSDNFLPTSPVPTSANVVRLSYGSPQIDIHFYDGKHLQFTPPFDEKAIWDLCKNGQDVRVVQIRTDQGMLPHLEWMDTPGIDSTDPVHMANTEDAVIIADHIFYVVDYNHVLASENYEFLTTIQEMKKPFHLVISMVDKHRESEIPFSSYKKSIIDSLSTWNLHPESIHFISIKNKSLGINEWDDFKHYLMELSQSGTSEMNEMAIIQKLAQDHEIWWKNQNQGQENELKDRLPSGINNEDALLKKAELDAELKDIETLKQQWIEDAATSGEKAVQSALLMPYETRELAKKYVESCQSNFKMGLFSSKGKIENERKARLEALCENLNQLLTTMKRQTTESLVSSLSGHLTLTEEMKQQIFSLNVTATKEIIENHVEKGALATGQYILNFTSSIETTFKKQMKQQINGLLTTIEPMVNEPLVKRHQELKVELTKCQEMLSHFEAYNDYNEKQNKHLQTLNQILIGELTLSQEEQNQMALEINQEDVTTEGHYLLSDVMPSHSDKMDNQTDDLISAPANELEYKEHQDKDWAKLFRKVVQTFQPIEGFHHLTQRLLKRAERLENKRYTIALFGAFSAGKSSFANALLGRNILPVSPHPTTATINRIFPIDHDHPNETVVITFKNVAKILEEVNQALEFYHIRIEQLSDLESALAKAENHDAESHHRVFLNAVIKGYQNVKSSLGNSISIPLNEALAYISEEQKACFVDTADIYYDCDLTRQGIVLVDTPGADSINARHTDTAFRFIRNADALVYVTYYNHAFSRADQEFLIQLGRVKDTFELDKMFFVINAIDLANSPSEVEDVKNYVRERLVSFGIRQARLYGVSSLKEIDGHSSETGFSSFYKDWKSFVEFGLQKQSIDQGVRDIEHAENLLDDLIKKMSLSELDKEKARKQVENDFNNAKDSVEKQTISTYQSRIKGEIEELFFYVKKRVIQRYIDEFSLFFNPSVLSGQQSESRKNLLRGCLDECVQFLSFDIDQEIRATYLRTESMLRKLIYEFRDQRRKLTGPDWAVELPEELDFTSPEIASSLKDNDRTSYEACFKHFKNPKQFFEGDGKMLLRDALQEMLSHTIDNVLNQNNEVTSKHYMSAFESTFDKDIEHTFMEMDTVYKQRMNALSQNDTLKEQLKATQNELKQVKGF